MNNTTWQKLYQLIGRTLIISQILGLITFKFSKTGLEKSKFKSYINIAILLVYIPSSIKVVINRFDTETFFVYKTTDIIQMTASLVYVTTALTHAIINQKNHLKLLKELIDYDTNFSYLGNTIDYRKNAIYIRNNLIIRFVIAAISFAGQFLTYNIPNPVFYVVSYIVYYIPLVINPIICLQSLSYIYLIKYRLQLLNQQVRTLTSSNYLNTINSIESVMLKFKNKKQVLILNNICSMHHHLTKIITVFNDTFGVTLLMVFGVSFVHIVVGLYYCSVGLKNENFDWKNFVNAALMSLSFIMDTTGVCQACHNTIEELKTTGILIHKIESDDHEVRDEIEMFSLQIANEETAFNAAGFFPVNFTLLFSIVGGVTTYIIILLQLSN